MKKAVVLTISAGLLGMLTACGPDSGAASTKLHAAPAGLLPSAGATLGSIIGEEQYGKVSVVPSHDEVEVMQLINELRTRGTLNGESSVRVGTCAANWTPLKPLDYSGVLALAARNHAVYTISNPIDWGNYPKPIELGGTAHIEAVTGKNFTGIQKEDRISYAASQANMISNGAPYGEIAIADMVSGIYQPMNVIGAVNGWLKSQHHCEAMMTPTFTHMGVGVAKSLVDGTTTSGWITNFGTYYNF